MKWEYDIMSAGNRVGKATVVPLGLYYDIQCKCKDLKGIIRIIAICGEKQENIGICVPINGELGIQTRIPQKRLKAINGFEAVREAPEEWFALTEGKMFTNLCDVIDGKFTYRNGKPGVSIPQAKPYKCP